MQSFTKTEQDKRYELAAWWTRWFILALFCITYPWGGPLDWTFIPMVSLVAGYNVFRRMFWRRGNKILLSRLIMILIDLIIISSVMLLTNGFSSPYYWFFVFSAIAATHWYGLLGLLYYCGIQLIITLFFLVVAGREIDLATGRSLVLKLGILIIVAFLSDRLSLADRLEQNKARNAHKASELERRRLLALINSLADAVIAIDGKNRISLYNGAALELLNTNVDFVGRPLDDVLTVLDINSHPLAATSLLGHGTISRRSDLMLETSDGSRMNLDISLTMISSSVSHVGKFSGGYIIVMRDITKQKSLDEERDEFIAVTSHELRTPLAIAEANLSTAMLPGYAKVDPKAKKLLEQAHDNIIFLGELVQDLTTLSKAERGSLKLDLSIVDPLLIIEQIARDYREQASAKGLKLATKVTDRPVPFLSGEFQIHEIMQNLVTNAIKYTPTGTITIGVEPRPGGGAIFSVKDSGIGIATENQKGLFTKFYRAEDFRTRQTTGTGLGLYITKKLAERLGGKVTYKSRLNHGSTFYLEVGPYQSPAHKLEDHPSQ